MIRAKHVLVLGAVFVACGGEPATQQGAISPSSTTTASSEPPPATPPPAATPPEDAKPAQPAFADVAKKTLAAIVEAQKTRDAKMAAAAYTDDAVLVTPAPVPAVAPQRATATGRDAIQKTYQEFYDGISNAKLGFSRVWIKGDVVIAEWISVFKHSGNLMGMKATDKQAGITGLSIVWLTPEGLIKQEHRYFDTPTIAGQVGLTKQPVRGVAVNVPATPEIALAKDGDDKNVDLLRAIYAAFEKKSEADFLTVLSDNPVHEDFSAPQAARGKDAAKKDLADLNTAFPDGKTTVQSAWGVGDFAIAEVTFEGIQKGPLPGLPATKKPVKFSSVDIAKINKDGKVQTVWRYGDAADFMVQLGVVKPPPKPPEPAKPPAPKK